ncbi:uncharacterized protein LOC102378872 [Alligator sinensis]|uniref:Uncharacterized protein LOC102378872 n=1 Tax=Alligator sinensis TaxID=38654 RepID=A0A3Q0GUY0_ALLSI|nr:uncharacterized protein LOC102378872 [Alligator sinensis]
MDEEVIIIETPVTCSKWAAPAEQKDLAPSKRLCSSLAPLGPPMKLESLEQAGIGSSTATCPCTPFLSALVPIVQEALHVFSAGQGLPQLLEAVQARSNLDLAQLGGTREPERALVLVQQQPGVWLEMGKKTTAQLSGPGPSEDWTADHWHPREEGPMKPAGSEELVGDCLASSNWCPPLPALCSSQSLPAECSGHCCTPSQQLQKPALSRKKKSLQDEALSALAPLLWCILRPFNQGLSLSKMLEVLKMKHDMDLMVLSHEAGYADVTKLLARVPGLLLRRLGKQKCIVTLSTGIVNNSCDGRCSCHPGSWAG